MELLIPGLILVALMVYASTRIKRSAAAAFEAETVETDDLVIQKPEGFLNVIGGDRRFEFEAYSKEYGVDDAERFRQGRATLTVDGETECRDEIVGERSEVIGDDQYKITEAKRFESGVEFVVIRKTVEKNGRKYVFEVVRLAETSAEFARTTEAFAESLRLK